jgi:hypothetical protein
MNANEITFGVEIEAVIPASANIVVGPHGSGTLIPSLPGWKADRDPSIRARAGYIACEFVSPKLVGADGMRKLVADIAAIKAMGAKVNASCGFHVHVGFDRSNTVACERLATLISNFEKAIFATTGTKNRERGRWSRGIQRYGAASAAISQSRSNRYHVANFGSEHPTIEFRAFSASLNPQKIVAWVRMCVALVERSITAKRTTNWTAKAVKETSPIHRSGEGQTALTRLFYQLGWTRGRTNYAYGNVAGEGLPTIVRTKKTLMTLARKYDARP